MMRSGRKIAPLLPLLISAVWGPTAHAQSMEEKFHDLFVTAGYCTAFGAAIGTAALAWEPNPADNLRYVAMGASLGFIGGSLLGTYMIFSPGIADVPNSATETENLVYAPRRERTMVATSTAHRGPSVVIRPWLARDTWRPVGLEGAVKLAEF